MVSVGSDSPDRRHYVEAALRRMAPALPDRDVREVIDHALWSKGLRKASADRAAWLSLVSYVRHTQTDYDDLLADGYTVEEARFFCREKMIKALKSFGCVQFLHKIEIE